MVHPEKNDVDIYKLFHWGKQFEIKDRYQNKLMDVFIRLNGDAEVNRARVFSIRKSKELRDKLKNPDSDERIAFISAIMDIESQEELLHLLSLLNTRRLVQEAKKEVSIPLPKEPKSDASLEEMEKFQTEVDNYDNKYNEELTKVVLRLSEEYQNSLKEKTVEQLQKMYEREIINELCEREMMAKFRECTAFFGTYSDPEFKHRLFNSFEEFENLPTEIKEQYIEYYNDLEISPDELKKSLEATL